MLWNETKDLKKNQKYRFKKKSMQWFRGHASIEDKNSLALEETLKEIKTGTSLHQWFNSYLYKMYMGRIPGFTAWYYLIWWPIYWTEPFTTYQDIIQVKLLKLSKAALFFYVIKACREIYFGQNISDVNISRFLFKYILQCHEVTQNMEM